MPKRIGLIIGHERAFAEELIARCQRHADVSCELAQIGGIGERPISRYDTLVDRFSQHVPHYRAYLKTSVLAGTRVINDPFAVSSGDRFFATSLAANLGLTVPRTVLLPQNSYDSPVIPERCLRNLEYPLKWNAVADYVRWPAVLKRAERGGTARPAVVQRLEELWPAFNATGSQVMMLQERIDGAREIRCLCVGAEQVFLYELDPEQGRAVRHGDDGWLDAALREQLTGHAQLLCRALGYDLAGVQFMVRDGEPYVIEPADPIPDLEPETVGEKVFAQVSSAVAELAVDLARGRPRPGHRYLWSDALAVVRG